MSCCCKFQNLKETLLVQDFVTPNKLALWWIHSKRKSLKQLHCACSPIKRPIFDAPGTKNKPKPLPPIGKNLKKKKHVKMAQTMAIFHRIWLREGFKKKNS